MNEIKDSGKVTLTALPQSDDLEVISLVPEEQPEQSDKRGPKPKKLVAVVVQGYQVGRGLKRRIVNPDDIYRLAQIGSSDREIARWFDIDVSTLTYNFADVIEKGREDLKQSLRMAQIKLALTGNAVMLIWLGKNILGQTDTPTTTDDKKPLPWQDEE